MKVVAVSTCKSTTVTNRPHPGHMLPRAEAKSDHFYSIESIKLQCCIPLMAYHFTMTESRWSDVRALCSSFCNATVNDTGFCPSLCVPECPTTCQYSLIPSTTIAPSARSSKGSYKLDPFFIATFACLALGLLAACTYAIYLKHYSVRVRAQQRPGREVRVVGQVSSHSEPPSVGLQASAICAIKIHAYMKADDPLREMECAVCLNEFQDGEVLRLLPKCNHAFHMPCIDVWLGAHISCPMCRACIESHITVAPVSEDQTSPA